jgi:hypothetical protein
VEERGTELPTVSDPNARERFDAFVRRDPEMSFDALAKRVFATSLDYTLDAAGKVLTGSRAKPRKYTECWTLIRGATVRGAPKSEPVCPSCGAPLDIGMTGACSHCRAEVTSGDFDWVLSRIEQDESY